MFSPPLMHHHLGCPQFDMGNVGLRDNASVISTEKAQRVLGWKPRHDWGRG